jgi:hypothetical protein
VTNTLNRLERALGGNATQAPFSLPAEKQNWKTQLSSALESYMFSSEKAGLC